MEKEMQILTLIDENPDISQRQLSKITGQSLGTVNGLIKAMVDNQYIEIESSASNMLRYHITEKGLTYKARENYNDIIESFKKIKKLKKKINKIIEKEMENGETFFNIIYEEDEIFKLVKITIRELIKNNHNISLKIIESEEVDNRNIIGKTIVWNDNYNGNDIINIMK